jgi:RHS repeat-associated protein
MRQFFLFLIALSIQIATSAQSVVGLESIQSAADLQGSAGLVANQNITIPVFTPEPSMTGMVIRNRIALELNENQQQHYFDVPFTVKLNVKIEYKINAGDTWSQFNTDLEVSYHPGQGFKYNARQFVSIENAVTIKVTILSNNNATSAQLNVLKLVAERKVWFYRNLSGSIGAPVVTEAGTISNGEYKAEWPLPAVMSHSGIQLEWTWLEDDNAAAYYLQGTSTLDEAKVFNELGATRIDLGSSEEEYLIPLIYPGPGKLLWRVRYVGYYANGTRTDAPWSAIKQVPYNGHLNENLATAMDINWQATTSFAEEGKRKTVIQYFDGSLRPRQTVTKDNSTNQVVSAETFYDQQGRPAVQILPAPQMGNAITYFKNLNLFNQQVQHTDPALFFDLYPSNMQGNLYATETLSPSSGASRYYSPQNPSISQGENAHIPDAEGFAYTQTLFTPDGTGRVKLQGGVGKDLAMGTGRETRYFYGKPSQVELDVLFGAEAGYASHYAKNMVQDANGQMSVSYVDMHGRTVATALAGNAPTGTKALIPDNDNYPNQSPAIVSIDLMGTGDNIRRDNSLDATSSLLVPVSGTYTFNYTLTENALQMLVPSGSTKCYDCLYDLTFSITNEEGVTAPIIRRFTNVSVNNGEDDACGTPTAKLTFLVNGQPSGTATNSINFSEALQPGSYAVRKTLTISQSSLNKYLQTYANEFSGESYTSLFTLYKTQLEATLCPTVATQDCQTCLDAIGSYCTYRSNYLSAMGLTIAAPDLEQDIVRSYEKRLNTCNTLCSNGANPTSSDRPSIYREMMLADFTPGAGQYARLNAVFNDAGNTGISFAELTQNQALWNKYSIFSSANNGTSIPLASITAKYRKPLSATSVAGNYSFSDFFKDFNNQQDPIHNNGGSNILNTTVTPEIFTNRWKDNWAVQLLPYHPEYPLLLETETQAMRNAYIWGEQFNAVNTWAEANTKGFLFATGALPATKDVFYSGAGSAYNTDMNNRFSTSITYYTGVGNIWQLAFRNVMCQSTACGIIPNNPTAIAGTAGAKLNEIWEAFKGLYNAAREDHILKHLATKRNLPTAEYTALAAPASGFRLIFPNGLAELNTQAAIPSQAANITLAPECELRCSTYVDQWKEALLACPQLNSHANKTVLVNAIITRMIAVCKAGCDPAHPNGSSTKNPLNTTTADQSFSQIISQVFSTANLPIPLNTALCNPYLITTPAPYDAGPNTGPVGLYVIQQANGFSFCPRYLQVRQEAGNPATLAQLNTYLTNKYGESIGNDLYNDLQQCIGATASQQIVGKAIQTLPLFLRKSSQYSPQDECITCFGFDSLLVIFRNEFTQYNLAPYLGTELTTFQKEGNQLLGKYLINKTGVNITIDALLDAYAKANCSTQAKPRGYNLACRPANSTTATGIFYTPAPCSNAYDIAVVRAQFEYEYRRRQRMKEFEQAYINHCLANAGLESFTVSYQKKEYHYTLYYYDQAGNLVKTIPPAGVKPDLATDFLARVKSARDAGANIEISGLNRNVPEHGLATQYRYNSLNQVVSQISPDGGTSRFWYDRLGRLAVSQNNKQAVAPKKLYSYTLYDVLGRINEVGEKPQSTLMTDAICRTEADLALWLSNTSTGGVKTQITRTVYDQPHIGYAAPVPGSPGSFWQQNLRNRVAYSIVLPDENYSGTPAYKHGTFYSYDARGNVNDLVQDFAGHLLFAAVNRQKRIQYYFDLVSGKVNEVHYQAGQFDAFYHKYAYDAENRLTSVQTSRDYLYWERDAAYKYYAHGPLARTQLGELGVQGIDYAYTLQGWLKGINSNTIDINSPQNDMGADGLVGGANAHVARDAVAFSLHYNQTDYKKIGNNADGKGLGALPAALWNNGSTAYGQLYNGNIAAMVVHNTKLGDPLAYRYGYDQLNRLVNMDAFKNPFTAPAHSQDYKEQVTYDPNGNIVTYLRNGADADRGLAMDQLSYLYLKSGGRLVNNRLLQVTDAAGGNYVEDLKSQTNTTNYEYDAIGNLTKDDKENISSIQWTVYGKIASITKTDGYSLAYTYDASGNRIEKIYYKGATIAAAGEQVHYTWYVRDAQGNVMAVYEKKGSAGGVRHTETHLYGSSRLGIVKELTKKPTPISTSPVVIKKLTFTRGEKFFELSNHLGNVLAVVADKKLPVKATVGNAINFWLADVVTATGYYPFGMPMPGRNGIAFQSDWVPGRGFVAGNSYPDYLQVATRPYAPTPDAYRAGKEVELLPGFETATGTDELLVEIQAGSGVLSNDYPGGQGSNDMYGYYRYGFNGKEMDNEVSGAGNQYDYGFRIYNPRLGRFLSVDPLTPKFPFYTPYQFSGNKPISNIDLDGREDLYYLISFNEKTGLSQIKLTNQVDGLLCNCWGASLYVVYGGQTYYQSSFPTSSAGQWFFNDVLGAPNLDDALKKFVGLSKAELDLKFAEQQNVEEMREAIRVKRESEMQELLTNAILGANAARTKKGTYTNTKAKTIEAIIYRGISGRQFTKSTFKKFVTPYDETDKLTIYRGTKNGKSSGYFYTEDASYAASYGGVVTPFSVSRSGVNYLKSEGAISGLTGINAYPLPNTKSSGPELKIENTQLNELIQNAKQ